jgi:predicted RNase H-like HicB family nuclease
MSDGDSYQAAVANVQIIIDEWIETARIQNRPIPQAVGKLMYACSQAQDFSPRK